MTTIAAGRFISLDGVVEVPDQWDFPYYNDEMGAAVDATLGAADCMVSGSGSAGATPSSRRTVWWGRSPR
ncbi:hypothetical protein [Micromonospora sp. NPDC051006]|uniref:hypothetical protein n=1 Tax=Micromonospora sp. NPDC051006 TaxID=3364283 RepID=UPI003799EC59